MIVTGIEYIFLKELLHKRQLLIVLSLDLLFKTMIKYG